jgi:N-acetylated-alpha-linked acidic dipeptidase
MARIFGVELLRMADADVLPHDYDNYGREIGVYLDAAEKRYVSAFGATTPGFDAARDAARQLAAAGTAAQSAQASPAEDTAARARLNLALIAAEHAFLLEKGLPGRPWYRHAVYAPGEYTGYAAVVLPGVSDAIDAKDQARAQEQLTLLTHSLQQAAEALRVAH